MQKEYDVIITGGGLAGLTLSVQLKRAKPEISILVLESMAAAAPTAAHKVGESTVELATYYMREVLGIKDYLDEFELPKQGLRFFFRTETKQDISERVELGPYNRLKVPSHQLDRGTLENYLAKLTQELGTTLITGAKAKQVDLQAEMHEVTYEKDGKEYTAKTRWVADATGRASLLKRKLKFQKPMDHATNSVWWRLKGEIDINDWSENEKWKTFLEPKIRYLATVHFMDKGYWLWVIPLGSKNTSIGIVAHPDFHAFEDINTYEKALVWLQKNEPLAYKMLQPRGEGEGLLDFRVLKHFAHDSGEFYSTDRWGVTGEAGAFLDPLYSPGSDFISMNNTWLTDLILRELAGEDISIRTSVYQQSHRSHLENWITIYQNKYALMDSAQIMLVKICWDWAIYWAVPCLLFTNKGFTNLKVAKELFAADDSTGRKFGELNKAMQELFIAWHPFENKIFKNSYIDPFDVTCIRNFQLEMETQFAPKQLTEKISDNVKTLEKIAAEIFRVVSHQVKGTDLRMNVDPYAISLENENKERHLHGLAYDASIAADINSIVLANKN